MSRLRVALISVGLLAVVALGVIGWSLRRLFPVSADSSSPDFWVLAVLALVVDAPLFGSGIRDETRPRYTASACVALAIALRWGLEPAILVQVVAAAVSGVLQQYHPVGTIVLVERHVLALAATAVVPFHPAVWPSAVRGIDLPGYLALTVVWSVVTLAAYAVAARALYGRTLLGSAAQLGEDVLVAGGTTLLVTPLLVAESVWWSPLIVLPPVLRNTFARDQINRTRQASRDPTTGLLTRFGLDRAGEEITLYDYIRDRDPVPFGVVLLVSAVPLEVGRSLSRDFAERMIARVAHRLEEAYGPRRTGHLPGEGFVVLIAGLTGDDAVARARELAECTDRPIEIKGIPFVPETVAGVALSPQHGRDLDTLIRAASLAAEEAQRGGQRARLHVEREPTGSGRRVALLTEAAAVLRDPRRTGEIGVLYQPQVDLADGHLTGVEALCRWTHPRWGPVPSADLVEAIRSSEVMRELTARVLDLVTTQVRAWSQEGRPVRVAIDASAHDLRDPLFPDAVARAIDDHGVEPRLLTIEIAEHLASAEDPLVVRATARLHELGVGILVNSFGTGHASMQHLRALPVSGVKIDGSYVGRMLADPVDRAIVTGVHALAQALRLEVVADGVEDDGTARALARLPGLVGQGRQLGPVMTAAELGRWAG